MKKFNIPDFYKSSVIARIKHLRKEKDKRKMEFSPTFLDFGTVHFYTARHFGFCYGVENAIEIIYNTIEQNQDKKIFLLSEMIHNPKVNQDLLDLGVRFIMDTSGKNLIDWEEVTSDDIVVIPAFGTSLEIEAKLREIGIQIEKYDTTCPFVARVWKKTKKLGEENFSIIIHGKPKHEETLATFSHSKSNAPTVVIKDIDECKVLGDIILGNLPSETFYTKFEGRYSKGFDVNTDLDRISVVNQTTMLANETQEISDYLESIIEQKVGNAKLRDHFPDTRDTLCYATSDNQRATKGLLLQEADLAIVVGGYNSSNTSHLVELCEEKLPTYFISSSEKIESNDLINHFDFRNKKELQTSNWLPKDKLPKILITSGASCPDAMVDEVLTKVLSYYENTRTVDEVVQQVEETYS